MRLERNLPYWLLAGASLAWLGLAFLAPWARSQGWAWAELVYRLFDPVCHQIPGRSFQCFSHPLAACHRCMGLYTGFCLGLFTLPYLPRVREYLLAHPRVLLLFFVPLAVDWALLDLNRPPDRFVTGLIAAYPVALFVWVALEQLYQQHFRPPLRAEHEWNRAQ